jgi:cell division protein FtsN
MLLASPAVATVKDGVDAWQAGNYAKAIAEWRQPAEAGDADAQFNLGQAYKLGRGVPADSKVAQSWYLKAAQQNHEQAQANLGLILFQGGDRQAAMPWITKAAQSGEPRAQYVLGTAMFNGDLVPRDWPRAYALMTRAAAAGLPQAATSLQQMDKYLTVADRQAGAVLAQQMESGGGFAPTPPPAVAVATVAKTDRTKPATAKPKPPKTAVAAPIQTAVVAPSTAPMPAPPTAKPAPVPVPVPAATSPGSKSWQIQLGAYGSVAGAQKVWGEIAKNAVVNGKTPAYIPVGALTRLRTGPFSGKSDANAACQALQKAGFNCFPVAP